MPQHRTDAFIYIIINLTTASSLSKPVVDNYYPHCHWTMRRSVTGRAGGGDCAA